MKKVVQIALVVITMLLAIATLAVLSSSAQASKSQFKWEHFGADPYATSREGAMKTRENAFRKLGIPEDVVQVFMIATDKPGVKVRIVNGDNLDAMLSKGGVVHKNVTVAFVKPPISGKMEYAAPAEKWQVTYGGKVYDLYLPEVCNNWSYTASAASLPPAPQSAPSPAPLVFKSIPGACPDVYTLKVNVWERRAASLSGVRNSISVEQRMAQEELQENFVGTPHVSRMHGSQFRTAHAAGDLLWAKAPHAFRVSLIMTPEAQGGSPKITSEEILGDVTVSGIYYELRFTRAQLDKWDAIRLVSVDGEVISPPRYHLTGYHEMRFFNHLPGTTLGEWDANPVPDCIMNEHWIE